MPTHRALLPRLDAALRGEKVAPSEELERGIHGSINYLRMGIGTWLLRLLAGRDGAAPERAEARARWLELMRWHREAGHLSRRGPEGLVSEAGSPGAHWSFNLKPVLGVWRRALELKDDELAAECEADVARELRLDMEFRLGRTVSMPCSRVKEGDQGEDKNQAPFDKARDLFVRVALGEARPPRKPGSTEAPTLLAAILDRPGGREIRQRLLDAPPVRLAIPIRRWAMPLGYFAEIEDAPDARRVLGQDGCNWVLAELGEPLRFGVDWAPRPEGLELDGEGELIGGAP